jgi:hypothetical protein
LLIFGAFIILEELELDYDFIDNLTVSTAIEGVSIAASVSNIEKITEMVSEMPNEVSNLQY